MIDRDLAVLYGVETRMSMFHGTLENDKGHNLKEIVLIDNYVDETVLSILEKRADGVKATIHTRYNEKFKTDLK